MPFYAILLLLSWLSDIRDWLIFPLSILSLHPSNHQASSSLVRKLLQQFWRNTFTIDDILIEHCNDALSSAGCWWMDVTWIVNSQQLLSEITFAWCCLDNFLPDVKLNYLIQSRRLRSLKIWHYQVWTNDCKKTLSTAIFENKSCPLFPNTYSATVSILILACLQQPIKMSKSSYWELVMHQWKVSAAIFAYHHSKISSPDILGNVNPSLVAEGRKSGKLFSFRKVNIISRRGVTELFLARLNIWWGKGMIRTYLVTSSHT